MAQRVLHLIPYTPQMGACFVPYDAFEDMIWHSQIQEPEKAGQIDQGSSSGAEEKPLQAE